LCTTSATTDQTRVGPVAGPAFCADASGGRLATDAPGRWHHLYATSRAGVTATTSATPTATSSLPSSGTSPFRLRPRPHRAAHRPMTTHGGPYRWPATHPT